MYACLKSHNWKKWHVSKNRLPRATQWEFINSIVFKLQNLSSFPYPYIKLCKAIIVIKKEHSHYLFIFWYLQVYSLRKIIDEIRLSSIDQITKHHIKTNSFNGIQLIWGNLLSKNTEMLSGFVYLLSFSADLDFSKL